jgi:hypothetical protein
MVNMDLVHMAVFLTKLRVLQALLLRGAQACLNHLQVVLVLRSALHKELGRLARILTLRPSPVKAGKRSGLGLTRVHTIRITGVVCYIDIYRFDTLTK